MTVSLNPPARGTNFTRYCTALALAKGDALAAAEIAERRWGGGSLPARVLKTAVVAGSLTPAQTWGEELSDYTAAAAEFFAAVREQSVVGRMIGLRRVPLNVRTIFQTAAAGGYWVGEGRPKPLTSALYAASTLPPLKIAALAVITQELARSSDPAAEQTTRNDLIAALVAVLDTAFLDPSNSGVTDLTPASVTNGAPSETVSGNYTNDLRALVEAFTGDLSRAFFVARPEIFVALSDLSRPNIGARGGELLGIPALASRNAPAEALALIDAGAVAFGAGATEVRVSTQGTVEMATDPTNTTTDDSTNGMGSEVVALWQTNSAGILVEQKVNWAAATGASALLLGDSGGF